MAQVRKAVGRIISINETLMFHHKVVISSVSKPYSYQLQLKLLQDL